MDGNDLVASRFLREHFNRYDAAGHLLTLY